MVKPSLYATDDRAIPTVESREYEIFSTYDYCNVVFHYGSGNRKVITFPDFTLALNYALNKDAANRENNIHTDRPMLYVAHNDIAHGGDGGWFMMPPKDYQKWLDVYNEIKGTKYYIPEHLKPQVYQKPEKAKTNAAGTAKRRKSRKK